MIDNTKILNDKTMILDEDCLLPSTKTAHYTKECPALVVSGSMKIRQVENNLDMQGGHLFPKNQCYGSFLCGFIT